MLTVHLTLVLESWLSPLQRGVPAPIAPVWLAVPAMHGLSHIVPPWLLRELAPCWSGLPVECEPPAITFTVHMEES